MKLSVTTLDAKAAGTIQLDDAIFGLTEIRADILQRMVKYQLAKRRAGTHAAQSRSDVTTSHSKIYKQKGTGGARHGSKNAPIFRGGGVAHPPRPRDHAHSLPKKVRALALRHALSAKAAAGEIVILDGLSLEGAKTADLRARLAKLELTNALMIAGPVVDANLAKAARNIPDIDVLPDAGLNVYDILRRRKLVLTKEAVAAIGARFEVKAIEPAKAIKPAKAAKAAKPAGEVA